MASPVTSTPFVGEVVSFPSPVRPDVVFGIRRVGTRGVISHRNRNSAVRYIQRDETGEFISEKDYPVGSNMLDTIALCLDSWNLVDVNGNPLKIDENAIQDHISDPEEFDALYEKALEVNPVLGPGGRDARKKD